MPPFYREDSNFKMSGKMVSDEVYRTAIESLIIVDVDVLLYSSRERCIYLAKRIVKPMPGLWLVGGRMLAGEAPIDAARRVTKQDTSLDLLTERFVFLRMNRYLWKEREQEPQEKGSDNLAYTFALDISEAERAQASANLHPEEYDAPIGLQSFDKETLKAQGVHQAIIDLYSLVFEK